MYSLIRNLLFKLEPEHSHTLSLRALSYLEKLGVSRLLFGSRPYLPINLMGLTFPNPIGLAAGLDKNGDYIDALAALGFGFIEVGTVTPKPQAGNPKPRLFRLQKDKAIINRMGFNNKGVEYLKNRLSHSNYNGILGINIGKNKDTPESEAINDYLICLKTIYQYASYITINISSPNTPGLRDLQKIQSLDNLLSSLILERDHLAKQHKIRVPLVVKIAPDLNEKELSDIAHLMLKINLDGIIISNTTLSRDGVSQTQFANETGGLSGAPLLPLATHAQSVVHSILQGKIPIIGVGGITDPDNALQKIDAGANLLQLYTGFIYTGPKLVKNIIATLSKKNTSTVA